jgi:iron complex outermembrane receptor protein
MRRMWLLVFSCCALPVFAGADDAGTADAGAGPLRELSRMSLEQLANVEVTSVSKAAQSLSTAPASIYVITHEEIRQSGALSIPEALRLAPNLQIAQTSAGEYQIGARGFGGNLEAQNFPNKILILIDGRSVYNPLFSGVTYDALDVFMDDIDRIEVISGPGATLWGSNAMNGVINIITRRAGETSGALLRATVGDQENAFAARYGHAFDGGAFRVYAKAFDRGPSELEDGSSAGDRWHKAQGGFRTEFARGAHAFTIQGDLQSATLDTGPSPEVDFTQYNVLGRWEHTGERGDTRLQVYFDRTTRDKPPSGIAFDLSTYDLEFQQSLALGARHRVVWGVGRRYNDYDIANTPTLFFVPASRTLDLTNVFAQDTMRLSEHVALTAGIKFEDNSYSGWETLPDLRVSWTPTDATLVWAAAARAVRSPTPLDVDVRESFGGPPVLFGDPDFETEKVWAYELGYRAQPHPSISWTVAAFYNDYDDLRSIEVTPVTFFPLAWANNIEGATYGVDLWANWQVTSWWRLSPGFRSLHKRLRFSEGASGVLGVQQAGNDPRSQASLKSSMTFGRFAVDAMLRYVGKLPQPATDEVTELGARVAYHVSDSLELSITGTNLLDERHVEYAAPSGHELRRAVYAEARLIF